MTSRTPLFNNLVSSFFLMIVISAGSLCGVSPARTKGGQPASSAGLPDVTGTWSGTFVSKHANVAFFAMTVVISQDPSGGLVGSASLNSDCLKGAELKVTVTGSKVVLAGSNDEGHNITVRGRLDNTGTLLKSTYILNGSATGNCETDDGSGDLVKR